MRRALRAAHHRATSLRMVRVVTSREEIVEQELRRLEKQQAEALEPPGEQTHHPPPETE